MTSDHKLPQMQSMYDLLKKPNKLYHSKESSKTISENNYIPPIWKTCRYKVYYNEGLLVKQATENTM